MILSNNLSKLLATFLLKNDYIDSEQLPIYVYCLNYILEQLFFFIVIEVLSCILGLPVLGILFFSTIVPLRSFCGGFHASARGWCIFLSYGCFFLTYFLCNIMDNLPVFFWIIFFFICLMLLYFLPIVIHKNRHFTREQMDKMLKYKRISCILSYFLFAIFFVLDINKCYHILTICVSIILSSVAIALLMARQKGGYFFDI